MKAELRNLYCVDVDDLATFQPATEAFHLPFRAEIGSVGTKGADSFDFGVCSLAWLKAELETFALVQAQHLLVVERFDLGVIEGHIRRLVDEASGPNWPFVARQLSQWSRWEGEGLKRES